MGRGSIGTAFLVLLATSCAGVLHAPWWAAVAGACSLVLISFANQRVMSYPQWRGVSEPVLIFSSVLNASAAASAVFLFGYVARWAWGL